MSRPQKLTVEYFPEWSPQNGTKMRMTSLDRKTRYKAIRNSSSSFIKNRYVIEYIYNRDGNECAICGSNKNIQIDHIISVYLASINEEYLDILNTKENLRLLCLKCNCSRQPSEI